MDEIVKIAETDKEIEECYPVLCQLHEHLCSNEIVEHVRRLESSGYRLVYLAAGASVKAVGGFHLGESFGWKRYLYVDDLVTDDDSRSKGYGSRLMLWLIEHARHNACDQLHLDSRVTRYATHKFYLNQGLFIGGYHFLISLNDET